MGVANVIPGVSGGTIAFITGIYQRLLDALKSFGPKAIRLLLKFDIKGFSQHVDLPFLIALGVGVVTSIVALSGLLEGWFDTHPTLVWSFFFGLILASVPSVARMVGKWTASRWLALVIGLVIAVGMSFLPPAQENANPIYLMLCGVAAMCSMIIPGISGSFVLLLMGNYLLVLRAVNDRNFVQLGLIGVGAVVGLLALSHVLSWLFRRYNDVAVALITGFVVGSLRIIWPWKSAAEKATFEVDGETKEKVVSYAYEFPELGSPQTWIAIGLMVLGAVILLAVDRAGAVRNETKA